MAEGSPTIAQHSGMGAIPNAKGATFRVWAPHAEIVYLIGTFNRWNETSMGCPAPVKSALVVLSSNIFTGTIGGRMISQILVPTDGSEVAQKAIGRSV